MPLTIQPQGSKESGLCSCCGSVSKTVWGSVADDDLCVAVYFVHWTRDEVLRHGAHFDLILGEWGEGTDAAERRSVALAYRRFETGPSFMVIDAVGRPFTASPIAGRALARDDVIGTPVAEAAFMVVDTILLQDPRVGELMPHESKAGTAPA